MWNPGEFISSPLILSGNAIFVNNTLKKCLDNGNDGNMFIYKPACAKNRQGMGVTFNQGCVLMVVYNILTLIRVWVIGINIYVCSIINYLLKQLDTAKPFVDEICCKLLSVPCLWYSGTPLLSCQWVSHKESHVSPRNIAATSRSS